MPTMTLKRSTEILTNFMPQGEFLTVKSSRRGEEGEFFKELMGTLSERIMNMPKVYEQDGKGKKAVAYLHYFNGGMDFYITERDFEIDDQQQAFGYSNMGQGYEIGYICIKELIAAGVELDLYFEPKTIEDLAI